MCAFIIPKKPEVSPFDPPWWLKNNHIQSLSPYMFHNKRKINYRKEVFELVDGDFAETAWVGAEEGPIVFILHGLEGSIDSYYANEFLYTLQTNGWRGLFVHFRNCSTERNRLDRLYHMGDTGDILNIASIIKNREPTTPMAGVGFSLGANVLTKWMGEMGNHCPFKAAVSVCNPFDLEATSKTIHSTKFGRLYENVLLSFMKKSLKKKFSHLENPPIDFDALNKVNSFRKFDTLVTAPLHGFGDIHDYYQYASSYNYLKKIKKPMLFINALDDPLIEESVLPHIDEFPSQAKVEYYPHGGHVGFITQSKEHRFKTEYWLGHKLLNFLHDHLYEQAQDSSEKKFAQQTEEKSLEHLDRRGMNKNLNDQI